MTLTYNQGIHGAQDQANALLRSGLPFSVITDDWRPESFRTSFESWAKAAMTVTTLKSAKIALFGYPMNGMGDILYEAPALMRRIGPVVVNENLGELYAKMQDVSEAEINSLMALHRERFEVSADLPRRQPCVRGASRNSACAPCSRTAVTQVSRSTSNRWAKTAASISCPCWPPPT